MRLALNSLFFILILTGNLKADVIQHGNLDQIFNSIFEKHNVDKKMLKGKCTTDLISLCQYSIDDTLFFADTNDKFKLRKIYFIHPFKHTKADYDHFRSVIIANTWALNPDKNLKEIVEISLKILKVFTRKAKLNNEELFSANLGVTDFKLNEVSYYITPSLGGFYFEARFPE